MGIDLHLHSNASDGSMKPAELVKKAHESGLTTIALVDHESTEGYREAVMEGDKYGIKVIPGIELLTYFKGSEIHLLGYYMDLDAPGLQSKLAELRATRTDCAYKTVEKMRKLGFDIDWEEILKISPYDSAISKGHIMHAIYQAGYIQNKMDATEILQKYLNKTGLAYTCYNFPFGEGVELIRESGGIPVLAHPGLIDKENLIPELLKFDIKGIEVYYYYFGSKREFLINKYEKLAGEMGLIMTGGSDYHGVYTPIPLGDIKVPEDVIIQLWDTKHKIINTNLC